MTVLDAAIKINTFSALNFESKANVIKEKMDLYVNVDKEKCFNELTLSIDKSLQINPSIDNDVWVLKFDSIIEFSKEKDKDKLLIEIINSLKIQSLYSPVVSKLILAYCKYKKTSDFEENDTVKLIDENKNKYYPENDVESINILIEALSHYKQKEQLEYLFSECELLKKVRKNRSYIYKKAEVIANLFADIPRAIKVITESQDYNKSLKLIIQLINLLTDLGQHEEAEKILNEHSDEISLESKLELQRGIFDSSDRIQEAIDCCLKIKPNKNNEQSRVTTLSYLYLRKGDYEAAKRTAKVFLEKVNYDTRYDATLLNYDYALFKLGSHLNKGRVDNVLKTTKSENVKGVCHLLLGDRK